MSNTISASYHAHEERGSCTCTVSRSRMDRMHRRHNMHAIHQTKLVRIKTARTQIISHPNTFTHNTSRTGADMTDANGKTIKQITEATAGKEQYYVIRYTDGTSRTIMHQTGIIKKWLQTQR